MSAEVSSNCEEWSISCVSDGEEFAPSAEELETYYIALENGNIPELQWQCPGRRAPSPVNNKEEPKVTEIVEKEVPAKNDFDFDMDDVATPQIRIRNQNSTPKSAKRKTANFAGVMESLKKQHSQSKEGS